MSEPIKDKAGNELNVGDLIASAVCVYQNCALRIGKIIRFTKTGLITITKEKDSMQMWDSKDYCTVRPGNSILLAEAANVL